MLTLSRGADSLVVAPEYGGAIVGWSRGGHPVLRRAGPEAVLAGDPGAMGCFPMLPYCNRVGFRHFEWMGEHYELTPNFGDHPHAIHGVGWKRPWEIEAVSADSVSLSLRHDANGPARGHWPFAFDATLQYSLTGPGLLIQMVAVNRHKGSAPMGLGLHPYFPRRPGAMVTFAATGVWNNDATALPANHGPVPPGWSHGTGRMVGDPPLDNFFTGWDGAATLPDLRIEADDTFRNLQVYTPKSADFFCVEPVSHAPDAINGAVPPEQAMMVLAPNETLRGTIRFLPSARD